MLAELVLEDLRSYPQIPTQGIDRVLEPENTLDPHG